MNFNQPDNSSPEASNSPLTPQTLLESCQALNKKLKDLEISSQSPDVKEYAFEYFALRAAVDEFYYETELPTQDFALVEEAMQTLLTGPKIRLFESRMDADLDSPLRTEWRIKHAFKTWPKPVREAARKQVTDGLSRSKLAR